MITTFTGISLSGETVKNEDGGIVKSERGGWDGFRNAILISLDTLLRTGH